MASTVMWLKMAVAGISMRLAISELRWPTIWTPRSWPVRRSFELPRTGEAPQLARQRLGEWLQADLDGRELATRSCSLASWSRTRSCMARAGSRSARSSTRTTRRGIDITAPMITTPATTMVARSSGSELVEDDAWPASGPAGRGPAAVQTSEAFLEIVARSDGR